MLRTVFPNKVRIVPKSRGKKGKDWKRFYAVQFSSFIGWWTIKEKDTMEDAEKFVKEFCNKPTSITYTFLK